MWRKKYLIHVPEHGLAVFKTGASLKLLHFTPGPAVPHAQWVKNHDITVEGSLNFDYLHRDIRVPFGTDLADKNVEQTLSEVLGKRRKAYNSIFWHEFFREDTKQGTSFRVFISLHKNGAPKWNPDFSLPAEIAVLALAGKTMELLGKPHCQIFYQLPQGLFSVLTIDHSPFHLLRFSAENPAEICARLKKHALFGIAVSKKLKKIPLMILPESGEVISKHLRNESCWEILPPSELASRPECLLHTGLALAIRDRDLTRHNRTPVEVKGENRAIRGRNRFVKSLLATLLLCAFISAVYGIQFITAQNRLNQILELASEHEPALAAIQKQRDKIHILTDSLHSLKPLWHLPTPWHTVFQQIGYAMPSHSGIDGFTVQPLANGNKALQFKAWVRAKDWDSVSVAQQRLEQSPFLKKVALSEQKHNLNKNIVEFHVSCIVEKY